MTHMAQVCVDLEGCFAAGQAYVALSRARTMQGLQVNGPKAFKPQQGDGTPVRPFNPFKKPRAGEETPV